jgi:CRP/FNR family transcriptional regulator, cyclic AMP receptor protein
MSDHDLLGFLASGLVLTSFWMRDMLSLRLVAIASNVAFINYGHVAHIVPVMALHAILLPVNLWHVLPMLRRALATWLDRTASGSRVPRVAREK